MREPFIEEARQRLKGNVRVFAEPGLYWKSFSLVARKKHWRYPLIKSALGTAADSLGREIERFEYDRALRTLRSAATVKHVKTSTDTRYNRK